MAPKKPLLEDISCAFCGKNGREVSAMIGGKHAFICGECLNACNELVWAKWRAKLGIKRKGKARKQSC